MPHEARRGAAQRQLQLADRADALLGEAVGGLVGMIGGDAEGVEALRLIKAAAFIDRTTPSTTIA